MAYPRPNPYDSRSPHDSERSRLSWDSTQRSHYPSMPSPSHHPMASPSLFDPESESSDVSDNPGDDYQTRMHSTYPASLPPPPAKHMLESLDSIEARLRELQRVEDHNIKKQDQLKAKRARKDERVRRKREAQDTKIKAIMDARARRDDRISRRRKTEDDAFERFDQDLEEEENNLRRRQKRLKRGLPVEDMGIGSRISSISMSPPGPTYSSIPPPPKRHQTGHPGQNDSPVTSTPRPILHSAPPAPSPAGPNPPPYAFLQSSHPPPPTSSPYGRSPTVSHSPAGPSGPFQPMHRSHQPVSEPAPYSVNGHPPSPQTSRPSFGPGGPTLNTAPPPRQPSSSYDTRPPPPVSSGFATINTPAASGFAAINPRNTATPPAPASVPLAKNADHERTNGHLRPYVTEGTPTGIAANASSKRTPSTTHPYQMSEAFANRHHHCERVDHLNRGIWTSYGPGGTKEMPQGPAQEMYLRCNHNGCRRIDWRTVHGLQCHIVKNHEQPKGTIGSLEKALDRYGVPVTEVEAYEREHGDGTGGTMADPKNLKLKTKSRESTEKADAPRRPYVTQPNSDAYKTNLAMSLGSSAPPYQGSPASLRSLPQEETEESEGESKHTPVHLAAKPLQPLAGFAAVNVGWSTVPVPKASDSAKDHEMRDAPISPQVSHPGSVPTKRDGNFWKMWPEAPAHAKTESVGNASAPSPVPVPTREPPTSAPAQQPRENALNHSRAGVTPLTSAPAVHAPSVAPTQIPRIPQPERPLPEEQRKDNLPAVPIKAQSAIQNQPTATNAENVQDTHMTGTTVKQSNAEQPSMAAQENDVIPMPDLPKEPEKVKAEVVEPSRTEPKSPENLTRRTSIIGVRRGSSRRSSLAASRAEKEREKERGEAAAAAAAKAEAEAEAERARDRQEREEMQKKIEIEQDKEADRDEEVEKEEESDDPDTITMAISSTSSRDRDREKDRENRENKTTPRRLANGRFVRKR